MTGVVTAAVIGVAAGLIVWRLIPTRGDMGWLPAIVVGGIGAFTGSGIAALLDRDTAVLPSGATGIASAALGALVVTGIYLITSRRRLARERPDPDPS